MPLKSVRFKSTRITEKGNGKLFFIFMVSTAFIITGLLEKLSKSNYQLFDPPSDINQSYIEDVQARRYCDPPNMTVITIYYDSSEETEEYDLQHQETVIESDVSVEDIAEQKVDIFSTWGLILSFFPACFLTSKYGPDKVFLFSILLGVVVVFGSSETHAPETVEGSIFGFILGVIKLSFYEMTFQFVSVGRNSLIALSSVHQIGVAIADLLAVYSIKKRYGIYATAVAAVVWFLVFSRIHITFSKKNAHYDQEKSKTAKSSSTRTPWKNILCSRPVWMTIAAIFGGSSGMVCIFTAIRLYLKYVYLLQVEILSAASGLLHAGFAIICGCFIDFLLRAQIVSQTSSRRMVVYISHFIPAGILFVLGFVGCDSTTPMVFYCLTIMMTSANYTGAYSSPLDLTQKYTKPILALCFTIGSLGSLSMNYLISYVLTKEVFVSWRFIFSLNSLILLLSAIFFMLRGSGSVQPWNDLGHTLTKEGKNVEYGSISVDLPAQKPRTKSIYMVEKKILKVLHVQEPDKFTRVRAYSTSLPSGRSKANLSNIYRPNYKKRASIS